MVREDLAVLLSAQAIQPWMHAKEIAVIAESLEPRHTMLEWGSGGSTLFFSQFVAHYYSIEHDPEWYMKVLGEVERQRLCINLFLVPQNLPRTKPSTYAQFKDYVDAVRQLGVSHFDRVLIDGRARPECAESLLAFIGRESLVFIHDFYMPGREYYHKVLDKYEEVEAVRDTPQTLAVLRKRD